MNTGQRVTNYDLAYGSHFGMLMEFTASEASCYQHTAWLCDLAIPLGAELTWTEYSTTLNLHRVAFNYKNAKIFATKYREESQTDIHIYADSDEDLSDTYYALRKAWPEVNLEDGDLPITFWALRATGPSQYVRRIEAPTWDLISSNYPSNDLNRLMALQPADITGGKVIIWHGQPGTGKTWALRALGEQWRKWCSFHYIVDPERFFGEQPAYMVDVLLEDADDKWRLIIMEDAGELLSADAKMRSGQGLSRLLNVTDGLIGQGLKVMFLITTNEESDKLHSAIKRQGRCLAEINFHSFEPAEAKQWLDSNDWTGDYPVARTTLADMYGILAGTVKPEKQRRIGFTP
jgi:hypothetical protein